MKIIFYLVFITSVCCVGIGCNRTSPPTPAVGRFQMHKEDTGTFVTPVIFDTATGRMYVGRTNGTFVVLDPVFEAKPPQ
jgi:hypothetical protein